MSSQTAPIPVPPRAGSAAEAARLDAFLLPGEHCDAYFIRRSPVLFVTFDNLGSVGEYDPPQPWLHMRVARGGFSILGIIARRKDWYRNDTAPALLTALKEAGLFEGFERVVFAGSSMGGFAALTFSAIIPGSTVIAFSPQSTLARKRVPFERRYRYAMRKWDWDSAPFLDAAGAVGAAERIYLFYDPFVPEDRAHAARLACPALHPVKCGHLGHKLIRQLKTCGVLDNLFGEIGRGSFDEPAFRRALRVRKGLRFWQRTLIADLKAAGHERLAAQAAAAVLRRDPGARFARPAGAP